MEELIIEMQGEYQADLGIVVGANNFQQVCVRSNPSQLVSENLNTLCHLFLAPADSFSRKVSSSSNMDKGLTNNLPSLTPSEDLSCCEVCATYIQKINRGLPSHVTGYE